jgi:hypothetical protein
MILPKKSSDPKESKLTAAASRVGWGVLIKREDLEAVSWSGRLGKIILQNEARSLSSIMTDGLTQHIL